MNYFYYLWSEIDRGHVRLKGEVPTLSHFLFWYIILIFGTMKEIKLTQGKIALVDDIDFDYLNQWKWCAKKCGIFTYAVKKNFMINKTKSLYMHRLIMNTPADLQVDHKDHNGLNNQRQNLRNCTCSQNRMNRIPRSKSGYLGVYYVKHYIVAQFPINGKMVHLGMFNTEKMAARKYDEYALKYYGEFANLNFK